MKFGIDVSSHQGKIDWDAVVSPSAYHSNPIDFVIFRGFIGSDKLPTNTKYDTAFQGCFRDFIIACDKANRTPNVSQSGSMKYGFYIIPYAMTVEKAVAEADKCLELLNAMHLYPKDADMGLWYDAEGEGGKGFSNLASLSKQAVGDICNAFCERVSKYGWRTGIYCNANWTRNEIDAATLAKWPLWLASYGANKADPPIPTSPVKSTPMASIWQYTSKGKVAGVKTNCDVNICYENW